MTINSTTKELSLFYYSLNFASVKFLFFFKSQDIILETSALANRIRSEISAHPSSPKRMATSQSTAGGPTWTVLSFCLTLLRGKEGSGCQTGCFLKGKVKHHPRLLGGAEAGLGGGEVFPGSGGGSEQETHPFPSQTNCSGSEPTF